MEPEPARSSGNDEAKTSFLFHKLIRQQGSVSVCIRAHMQCMYTQMYM